MSSHLNFQRLGSPTRPSSASSPKSANPSPLGHLSGLRCKGQRQLALWPYPKGSSLSSMGLQPETTQGRTAVLAELVWHPAHPPTLAPVCLTLLSTTPNTHTHILPGLSGSHTQVTTASKGSEGLQETPQAFKQPGPGPLRSGDARGCLMAGVPPSCTYEDIWMTVCLRSGHL